jgi:RNA polymerase sigma factor (sigma-70 family)
MSHAQLTDVVRRMRTAVSRRLDDRRDAELLHAFHARGEEDAFAAIVARYSGLVLGVCRRVLENAHDAEDAAQATFLVLARKAGRARRSPTLPGWLYVTAHRVALQVRRDATRRRRREGRVRHADPAGPVTELIWRELQAILDEEIRRLPPTLHGAFLLCCLDGLSHAEAARRLGIAEGTVSSRVTRARQRLHGRLRRRGIELSGVLAALAVGSVAWATLPAPARVALTRAAMQCATCGCGTLSGLSAHVVNLASGVSRSMSTAHMKLIALCLLAAGILGGVASLVPGQPAAAPAADEGPVAAEGARMPAKPDAPQPRRKAAHRFEVKGRVLGPDGKPVSGAKLYEPAATKPEPDAFEDIVVRVVATADAEGRYHASLRGSGYARDYLIAHAPGFGVDWIEIGDGKPLADATLRLSRDVPIHGRVVNTEGKPIAGVSVSVTAIYVPAGEKLDDYLAGWKKSLRDNLASPHKRLYVPLDAITGAATTGPNGRFTLRGAGAERIAHVTFAGGGVARSTPYVITREGFDPRAYNEVLLRKEHEDLRVLNRFLGLYAPNLTFIAEPGRTVEGVTRDAASGKPLPGCPVFSQTGFGDGVPSVSDASGKYRLDGLPKNPKGYTISVGPPKGAGYLSRIAHTPDSGGYTPVRFDIAVVKGVVVSGRVVDRQTGRGVLCGIRFAPLPGNRFFGSRPGFDNYLSDRTMEETDKQGHFRLVTIPGKALVMAQAHAAEMAQGVQIGPYRRAVPDPDHKELFRHDPDDDSWTVDSAGGLEFLNTENAVKVIDIKEEGENRVELFVDRGMTGQVTVQDAEGRPLAGAWLAGLTDHWPITYRLPAASATVYALNPKKPRTLVLFHPDRKLGGTVRVRGDEKEPVVAKLGPLGTVSGRMVELDGNPLVGAEISVNAQGEVARELYRFANPAGKMVVTDKDGRFRLPGVVPGVTFYLQIRRGEHYYGGKPKIGQRNLKPAQHLDLGDRTLEVLE